MKQQPSFKTLPPFAFLQSLYPIMKQLTTGDASHVLCADGGVLYAAQLLSSVSLDTVSMFAGPQALDVLAHQGVPLASALSDLRTGIAMQSTPDRTLASFLARITSILRDLPVDGEGRILVPLYPEYTAIATGALAQPLCALLRNDSMTDISGRCDLYHGVFELLKVSSSSPELCAVLRGGAPSVLELLQQMGRQADVFVRGSVSIMEGAADDEADEDDSDTLAAAGMAMSIRDAVEAVARNVGENSSGDTAAPAGDAKGRYEAAMQELRLEMVDMTSGPGRYRHHFNTQIQNEQASPVTMIRRMKELSTMATNLPVSWDSGVFLRVDENRNEVLKALIIGPAGTPYENGCFLFDIHLPAQYPDVPPFVQSMTTSGGAIRMNPNLYACGKVCLSLLGTWSGPGWEPGTSTLLQLLVSIQSLILVNDPFYNEPGFDNQPQKNSEEYNEYIRLFTCKAGMLEQLQHCDPAFESVIKTHFRLKRDQISAQVSSWLGRSRCRKHTPRLGFPLGDWGMGSQAGHIRSPAAVLGALQAELQKL
eukprot:Rhum_TRINITY_DN15176_c4_g2::Rhum_TRINITY_DN15176_c4_g2_i1::g.142341::m.142341/K10586/BIRC6, BRUCE; baculoviral IAP repeat-containing protein 6 (apollon)